MLGVNAYIEIHYYCTILAFLKKIPLLLLQYKIFSHKLVVLYNSVWYKSTADIPALTNPHNNKHFKFIYITFLPIILYIT